MGSEAEGEGGDGRRGRGSSQVRPAHGEALQPPLTRVVNGLHITYIGYIGYIWAGNKKATYGLAQDLSTHPYRSPRAHSSRHAVALWRRCCGEEVAGVREWGTRASDKGRGIAGA
jgi:hypothetical protein